MYQRFSITVVGCIVASFLALAMGCERTLPVNEVDRKYFPTDSARYRTYAVFSKSYNPADSVRKFFYKRELHEQQERDLNNRLRRVVRIEESPYDSLGFPPYAPEALRYKQLWQLWRTSDHSLRTEGNITYAVLGYPILVNRKWNGNQYNSSGTAQYQYRNIDTTVTLNGRTYSNCVFVVQRQNKSLVSDVYTYELYAPNIGKIARFDRFLTYEIRGNVGQRDITSDSYEYSETLVEHN
jgi:hypothetical protein